MYCLICEPIVELVESNLPIKYNENQSTFIQEYYCFSCGLVHDCTSQSGDMVRENLNIVD